LNHFYLKETSNCPFNDRCVALRRTVGREVSQRRSRVTGQDARESDRLTVLAFLLCCRILRFADSENFQSPFCVSVDALFFTSVLWGCRCCYCCLYSLLCCGGIFERLLPGRNRLCRDWYQCASWVLSQDCREYFQFLIGQMQVQSFRDIASLLVCSEWFWGQLAIS